MVKVAIKKTNKNAKLPTYMTSQSAGMDIYACLKNDLIIKPMERKIIPTGIAISLPDGYEAQIRPRSGLAFKHGIFPINTPGTIDPDYRGEIKIILANFGENDFIVKHGDRIAQMVINKYEKCEFEIVKELDKTDRGESGFGSTGI